MGECCTGATQGAPGSDARPDRPWIVGWLETPAGPVPQVPTKLERADRLGGLKVRLNIRRMEYTVAPGLYAVGNPTPDSPVFVSANYKLSFDCLRRELGGLDAWILVLDTDGINVWCAAGKGTFGTDEMVGRIEATALEKVVTHRTLIVPQLGAPGVSAHEVKKRSGFRVTYGPVRAVDIPAFLAAGMQATPEMRRVRFDLADRLVVVPVELALGGRYVLLVMACLFVLAGIHRGGYATDLALAHGSRAAILVLMSFLAGCVVTPILLPWLPGRAFSVKGLVVGAIVVGGALLSGWTPTQGGAAMVEAGAWFLLMPAVASFCAMNYTGASTYTSLSGVKMELRFALPAQIAAAVLGLGMWMTARFI